MPEDILLQVRRPAQYIGREWNAPARDFGSADIRIAMCFPDLYEVGMSNLGIRILYGLLNRRPKAACERFFSPDTDLEKILRESGRSIASLESQSKLSDFDLVGISLPSELCYTNVLNILDLGLIPLKSAERDNRFPLIIGGGPCTLNPEPMHEFFDLFLVGEGEDALLEIVDTYEGLHSAYKDSKVSKTELLARLSGIPGVYIPSLKGSRTRIMKRTVKDLDSAYFPKEWLVPYTQIIHDRVTLEIMRGCPNRCRFCQARTQYFPFRIRKPESICALAAETYKLTGYEEVSLTGLSVSDYPGIEALSCRLMELFEGRGVGLSLPSMKARSYAGGLSAIIAKVKKTGLTFAPEAGSQRLRECLAKDFNEDEFFDALRKAYESGYRRVKLYFMIGIPGENEEDLDEIIRFSTRVSELRREVSGRPAEVNVSINTLIPKPHTAFQWAGMSSPEEIKNKQDYLKSKNRNRRLKLNFHDRHAAFIEGVLSRGDRCLSRVILEAFKSGARFDAWSSHFSFPRWLEAFASCGVCAEGYLKEKSPEGDLPWDFIDPGLSKGELAAEFKKIVAI
jgi:radical SAM superfamily enzyme YgiQ (UPF0313 family)